MASVFGCLCLSDVLQPLIALSPGIRALVSVDQGVEKLLDSLFPPASEGEDKEQSGGLQAIGESTPDRTKYGAWPGLRAPETAT